MTSRPTTPRARYGDLPQDVLEGTRRSRFAPPIIRRSPLTAGAQSSALSQPGMPQPDPEAASEDIASEDIASEEGLPGAERSNDDVDNDPMDLEVDA